MDRIMQGRTGGLNRRRLGALAVGAVALLLSACAQPPARDTGPVGRAPAPATPAPATVDLSAPVTVALLVPLSASDPAAAAEARGLVEGARLALASASGLRLDVRDTAGRPETAAAAARAAIAEGAALILGPLYAANARAVAEPAAAAGVNVIAFSNTPSAAGGPVWLAGLLPGSEAERILTHAAAQGVRTVSLYRPDTPEGAVAAEAAAAAARRLGLRLHPDTAYPRSFEGIQDSAQAHAEAHRAAGAQALLLTDRDQGLQAAASFMAYHRVSVREGLLLGLSSWDGPATLTESALLGGRFAAPDPDRLALFAERYQAATGAAPTALAWIGHDAAAAAAQLLAAARRRDDRRPFDAAAITDRAGFQGAAGPFRFTADGLNVRSLAVVEVTRDGFVTREPVGALPVGPGA